MIVDRIRPWILRVVTFSIVALMIPAGAYAQVCREFGEGFPQYSALEEAINNSIKAKAERSSVSLEEAALQEFSKSVYVDAVLLGCDTGAPLGQESLGVPSWWAQSGLLNKFQGSLNVPDVSAFIASQKVEYVVNKLRKPEDLAKHYGAGELDSGVKTMMHERSRTHAQSRAYVGLPVELIESRVAAYNERVFSLARHKGVDLDLSGYEKLTGDRFPQFPLLLFRSSPHEATVDRVGGRIAIGVTGPKEFDKSYPAREEEYVFKFRKKGCKDAIQKVIVDGREPTLTVLAVLECVEQ